VKVRCVGIRARVVGEEQTHAYMRGMTSLRNTLSDESST